MIPLEVKILLAFVGIVVFLGVLVNTPGNYIYDSQPHLQTLPPICGYEACCTGDTNQKYTFCDNIGCMGAIPNWSPPDCSVKPLGGEK